MALRKRTRAWKASELIGTSVSSTGSLSYHNVGVPCSQVTEDEINAWPPKGPDKGKDVGGVFKSTTKDAEHTIFRPSEHILWADASGGGSYTGPVVASTDKYPGTNWWDYSNFSPSTEQQLSARGATAISRTVPTSPSADVSVMLGELFSQGVPKLIGASLLKNRFRDYRDIGAEYLNYQFGWAPIVRDIRSLSQAVLESEKILNQLERDSGRNVRRTYAFPIETLAVTKAGNRTPRPGLVPGMIWDAESATYTDTLTKRQWFSGCYTYHFERTHKERGPMAEAAQKARVLLGIDLTPEVLWNLTPWSWLTDWFWNMGDIMSNVSRFSRDGLVLRYGYIMEEFKFHRIHHMLNVRVQGGSRLIPRLETQYLTTYKARYPATPFGFGITPTSLDVRQWAILGALGISNGPKSFW